RQHHHGQVFIHQRGGTVLELARGIAFRVNVGNFFQFQRAFQGNRVVDVAADVDEILVFVELPGKDAALVVGGERALNVGRQVRQRVKRCIKQAICSAARLRYVSGKKKQGDELRGETLGCGDGDLFTGVGEQCAVCILRERRFRNIADGQR